MLKRIDIRKIALTIFLFAMLGGCSKSGSSISGTLSLNDFSTTYNFSFPPGSINYGNSGYAFVNISCSSADMSVTIYALSTAAPLVVGNYGTTMDCQVNEKSTAGELYTAKDSEALIPGTTQHQSGTLVITQKDEHVIKGTFAILGKNASGTITKNFTGSFTINL